MLTLTVRYDVNYVQITFPCAETTLRTALQKLKIKENENPSLFVWEVEEPEELGCLKDQFVDLDEINYLAKRMESFNKKELQRFLAVITQHCYETPKDMINLTFNLSHYSLIQDFTSPEAIGKEHLLCKQGGISIEEMDKGNLAAVGRQLVALGNGRISEYGLIFTNGDIPFVEVYDGQVYPEYHYEESLLQAKLTYHGRTEYAYLPCDDLAIEKCIRRLGADSIDGCEVQFIDFGMDDAAWFDTFKAILEREGLYIVNELAAQVDEEDELDVLVAAIEFADIEDAKSMMFLAKKVDHFIHIPIVEGEAELAYYWIEQNKEYQLNKELEPYFDYAKYGAKLHSELNGKFLTDGGYIFLEGNQRIEDFMQMNESEDMTMGGM